MANEIKAQELVQGIDVLAKEIADLVKSVAALREEFTKTQTVFDKNSKSQSELVDKTKAVQESTKNLDAVERERLALLKKLKTANSDNIQKNEELKVQLTKQKKTNKDLAKEKLGLIGAYEKESKKLIKLRNQYKDAAVQYGANSKEAAKLRSEVQKLDANLKKIDSSVGQSQRQVGNYKKAWAGLVGAFALVSGAIASARGVIKGIGNVIKSTQATGDKWAISLSGMKASYDAFNKSIASGDLKNVFKNMKDAFQAGKEYAAVLDDLGDRERALSILRAESNTQIENLTNTVQNVTLADKERIAAAKEIFTLEENLLKKGQSVRKQDFDAQVKIVSDLTGMRNDEVLAFIKNYDEEKALRETAIQAANLESDVKQDRLNQDLDGLAKSKAALKDYRESLTATEKAYIETYKGYSKTTDEELDKVVAAYTSLQEAESSSVAGQRRIRNQYNTLVKSLNKETVEDTKDTQEERTQIVIDEQLKRVEAEALQVVDEKKRQTDLINQWKDYYNKKGELRDNDSLSEDEIREKNYENAELAIDTTSELANTYFDYKNSLRESEISNLEAQRDAEVAAAEKAGQDTSQIVEKFARKEARLRADQAKAEKRQAIFTSVVNTASGIVKTAGTLGYPAAIPFIVALAAVGAAQQLAIAAEPIPKFKDGKVKINGKTHAQGGINAEIEKNESVISAKGTLGSEMLLTAINENKIKDSDIFIPSSFKMFKGADTPELAKQIKADIDLTPLIKEQQLTRRAIESKSITKNWTKDGLIELDSRTKSRKNYRSKWLH